MSQQASTDTSNSMLYFLVGGLLVAVLGVGYFVMSRSGGGDAAVSAAPAVASGAAEEEESDVEFKIDVAKDGRASGSIDQKPDD